MKERSKKNKFIKIGALTTLGLTIVTCSIYIPIMVYNSSSKNNDDFIAKNPGVKDSPPTSILPDLPAPISPEIPKPESPTFTPSLPTPVIPSKPIPPKPLPNVVLNIAPKNNEKTLFDNQIIGLNMIDNKNKIQILQQYFTNISEENIPNISILTNLDTNNNYVISLKTLDGFVFPNQETEIMQKVSRQITKGEQFIPKLNLGPKIPSEELADFLNKNSVYQINQEVFIHQNENLSELINSPFTSLINGLPTLSEDDQNVFELFCEENKTTRNEKQFKVKIYNKKDKGDYLKIYNYPWVKDIKTNDDLLIKVQGFYAADEIHESLTKIYSEEMDFIINDINQNGLTTSELSKTTFITPKNASDYTLEKLVNIKYPNSLYNPKRKYIYQFKDIKFNKKEGTVAFKVNVVIKDNQYKIYNSINDRNLNLNTVFTSKLSDEIKITVKPMSHYNESYDLQNENWRPKINIDKLNELIARQTKNNIKAYFAVKITRQDLEKIIDNYETRPNNVFLDYNANGDDGTLEINLIERNFGNSENAIIQNHISNNWESFKQLLKSHNEKNGALIKDRLLQTHKISGFKRFDDLSMEEKNGYTTFKKWYSWKKSFVFSVGYVDTGRTLWNKRKAFHPRWQGYGEGTAWLSHKISDTEFVFATNSHVAYLLKQANNDKKYWLTQNEDMFRKTTYSSSKWLFDNDFNYKNNITLRRVNDADARKYPHNSDYGALVSMKDGKVDSYDYNYITSQGSRNYKNTKHTLAADMDKITSIKLTKYFGKSHVDKNKSLTHVIEPFETYRPGSQYINRDREDIRMTGISIDLAYFTIKFNTPNNKFNNLWEEVGPTSFTPLDNMTLTNASDYETSKKLGQLTWNNFSYGGYPGIDEIENNPTDRSPLHHKFVYKGDGGLNQSQENDYLTTLIMGSHQLGQSNFSNLNTPAFLTHQKDNESINGGYSGSAIFDKNMSVIGILQSGTVWDKINPSKDSKNAFFGLGSPLMTDIDLKSSKDILFQGFGSNQSVFGNLINYDVTKIEKAT